MTEGKKIAAQNAGRKKSLPTFAEGDQSSRLLLARDSNNYFLELTEYWEKIFYRNAFS